MHGCVFRDEVVGAREFAIEAFVVGWCSSVSVVFNVFDHRCMLCLIIIGKAVPRDGMVTGSPTGSRAVPSLLTGTMWKMALHSRLE